MAICYYTNSLILNPAIADVYFNRGLAMWQQGNSSAACQDWEIAKEKGNQKVLIFLDKQCN